MLGANDQTHPPGASRGTAADGSPAASDTGGLGPRAWVVAISAVNFVTGSALLIIALLYLVGLLTYPGGANNPYRGITLLVEGGLSVGALLLGALFILAAVGLSMRRKGALRLASVTSILIHLIGLLTLCGLVTVNLFAAPVLLGIFLALVGPAMLFFLYKPEVRALYR